MLVIVLGLSWFGLLETDIAGFAAPNCGLGVCERACPTALLHPAPVILHAPAPAVFSAGCAVEIPNDFLFIVATRDAISFDQVSSPVMSKLVPPGLVLGLVHYLVSFLVRGWVYRFSICCLVWSMVPNHIALAILAVSNKADQRGRIPLSSKRSLDASAISEREEALVRLNSNAGWSSIATSRRILSDTKFDFCGVVIVFCLSFRRRLMQRTGRTYIHTYIRATEKSLGLWFSYSQ